MVNLGGYVDHSNKQKNLFHLSMIKESKHWKNPIVTQVISASKFFRAEEYHQDYLNKNNLGACSI